MATRTVALFDPADAAVIVALISAFAAIVGPIALALVSSLKRIRAAAELAAHNTQSNGHLDEQGEPTAPSPHDVVVAGQEYIIGQIHAVARQAESAARAAEQAKLAASATDAKADALRLSVDAGFAEAKRERERLSERLELNISNGATFADAIIGGALDFAARIDALDGGNSVAELKAQIEGTAEEDDRPEP